MTIIALIKLLMKHGSYAVEFDMLPRVTGVDRNQLERAHDELREQHEQHKCNFPPKVWQTRLQG